MDLFYWAGRNRELDFVLSRTNQLIAFEVKTTAKNQTTRDCRILKTVSCLKKTSCRQPGELLELISLRASTSNWEAAKRTQ